MKGFFGALCIFLLWTAACIYYVSTSELGTPDASSEVPSLTTFEQPELPIEELPGTAVPQSLNASNELLLEDGFQDTLDLSLNDLKTNKLSRTESQLLADEIMKSISVSDTVDFERDEPELKFENNLEISSGSAVIGNAFYPIYRNTDLIMDKDLVAYATELRQLLKDDPSRKVTVIGHTDNVGNARDNFISSLKKARQVKWYLTARRGIPRSKVTAISRGEEQPIESNKSIWGRKKNNRVQIIVE